MPGVKPPHEKKRKTKEEQLDTQRKYEAESKERQFQTNWQKGRPQLIPPIVGKGMTCSVCVEAMKENMKIGERGEQLKQAREH